MKEAVILSGAEEFANTARLLEVMKRLRPLLDSTPFKST
jgi:hypothetical protein